MRTDSWTVLVGVLLEPGFELVERFAAVGDLILLLLRHLRIRLAGGRILKR